MSDPDDRDVLEERIDHDHGTDRPAEELERTAHSEADSPDAEGDVTRQLPAIAPDAQLVAEPGDDAEPTDLPASVVVAPSPIPVTATPAVAANAASSLAADIPDPTPDAASEPVIVGYITVVRLSGADDGEVTSLVGDSIVIGRLADDVSVPLPHDQWVSRRHAQLTFRNGQWRIQDLHSSNGTFLGEQRISASEPTALPLGHVFRVGHTDLMLTDEPVHLSQGEIHL